jgi:hypothetical protein
VYARPRSDDRGQKPRRATSLFTCGVTLFVSLPSSPLGMGYNLLVYPVLYAAHVQAFSYEMWSEP